MIYNNSDEIVIRDMQLSDARIITEEEIAQGWDANVEKYEMRLKHQAEGKSISLVAEYKGDIAGYINVYPICQKRFDEFKECYSDVNSEPGSIKEKYIMSDIIEFADRNEFRKWLSEHCLSDEGVWLLFGKAGWPRTIKAGEALEEALCFGWIDGQMQSIDDKTYKKYFHMRREKSKWSEKNKALVGKLEERGLMTEYGRKKIEEAKENGQWDAPKPPAVTEEQVACVSTLLEEYEPAYTNWKNMPPSVKKTYTRAYFDAKTDAGREKRIAWMVDRLNKNLKPM